MLIFKNVSNLLFFNIFDFKMKFILKWYIFFSILKIPKIIRNNWFLLLLISKYVLFYNDIFFLDNFIFKRKSNPSILWI